MDATRILVTTQPPPLSLCSLVDCSSHRRLQPVQTAARDESLGLPLSVAQLPPYLNAVISRGELIAPHSVRDYWGENVAYYFAWQVREHAAWMRRERSHARC
jgi:hypothetical protein